MLGRKAHFALRHHRTYGARLNAYWRKVYVGGHIGAGDLSLPDHSNRLQTIVAGYNQITGTHQLNPARTAGRAHICTLGNAARKPGRGPVQVFDFLQI